MKSNLILLTLLAGLVTWAMPVAHAESGDNSPQITRKAKKGKKGKKVKKAESEENAPAEESAVGALLKKNTYFNNPEPNFNAQYFIFLKSASWCGPCNMEMPTVAKAYEQMKASGKVELILLSHDRTEEAAKGFLEKYGAKFPALMKGATLPEIPQGKGIPHATIMKADGTVIEEGHGSIIRGWKNQTIGEYAVIGDDGEPRVGKAMKGMKFANGKPNTKADFYIYMYMRDSGSADEELIAELARSYKDMKKAKVEVIYITTAKTPSHIAKFLKSKKAKFPGIQAHADGVNELPGLGKLGDSSCAYVVTQSGALVTEGAPSIATKWEKFVEANQ